MMRCYRLSVLALQEIFIVIRKRSSVTQNRREHPLSYYQTILHAKRRQTERAWKNLNHFTWLLTRNNMELPFLICYINISILLSLISNHVQYTWQRNSVYNTSCVFRIQIRPTFLNSHKNKSNSSSQETDQPSIAFNGHTWNLSNETKVEPVSLQESSLY